MRCLPPPWVARLGQAQPDHHLGLILAPQQQLICWERRISVKHDVIDILVIEVALSHSFSRIWLLHSPTSFLLMLFLSLLFILWPTAVYQYQGTVSHIYLICKLRHISGF